MCSTNCFLRTVILLNPPIVRDYYTEEIIGNASLHPNASTRTINVRKKTKIVKKKYYFSNDTVRIVGGGLSTVIGMF
ncbi:Uncharacterized protein FWK35_00009958 [Aphis craccivora]|uniref:Uncharacterized protein n=1 Tax=Aphis craccivora TaxID=307492 RepID=A0A6G0YFC1_APHCR|nr:Uncharacterized protein FWK35_00009958 [Aphis craccivora]